MTARGTAGRSEGRAAVTAVTYLGVALGLACIFEVLTLGQSGGSAPPLDVLLARVSERVERYYRDLTAIRATETVRQQRLSGSLAPSGRPKQFLFDLMIVREPSPGDRPELRLKEVRELTLVDGKPPRKGRPACDDPATAYLDYLLLLLPSQRSRFRFAAGADADLDGQRRLTIEFAPAAVQASRVEWRDECFHLNAQTHGRIWIDPTSYDVLRVDEHLGQPVLFFGRDVLGGSGRRLRLIRWDLSLRFAPVSFDDPPETVLLPETAESLLVIEGAREPRLRTTHRFGPYQRFRTGGRVVPPGD